MSNENILWTSQEQIEMERFCDLMATFIEKYGDMINVENDEMSEVVDNATSLLFTFGYCVLKRCMI